ncbi:hypothetical protein D9M68_933880 [compost metagenome]
MNLGVFASCKVDLSRRFCSIRAAGVGFGNGYGERRARLPQRESAESRSDWILTEEVLEPKSFQQAIGFIPVGSDQKEAVAEPSRKKRCCQETNLSAADTSR